MTSSSTTSRCIAGGCDDSVKVWNFQQAIWDVDANAVGIHRNHATISDRNYLVSNLPTKSSSVSHLHFTRRNLLIAVCLFENS